MKVIKIFCIQFLDNYSNENSPISDTNISPSENINLNMKLLYLFQMMNN